MKKSLILAAALLLSAGAADAKWWLFGKSNDEVGLKYLYINSVSADEAGPKIKVFREALGAGGLVKITGKASTGKGAVGSVRISLDDKATWTDVKFSDNGTFEYAFKPEQGKTYPMLLEVTDTAGKTNKVEETRKEISLSEENIQAKVKETLDAMFAAYNTQNLRKFMGYVGEDFAGDKAILERAVKRDFDALSSINLRYTVNNIAAGAQGRVFVSVTYNRMVFVNKTGATSTDSGATEFVFDSNEGKLSLFSMKQPLMFGLSDAENVATGAVLGNTGAALFLDDSGSLGGAVRTLTLTNPDWTANTRTITLDDLTTQLEAGFHAVAIGDIGLDTNHLPLNTYAEAKLVTGKALEQLTLADLSASSGWTGPPMIAGSGSSWSPGTVFGIRLHGAAYYAIEVVSNDVGSLPAFTMVVKVRSF